MCLLVVLLLLLTTALPTEAVTYYLNPAGGSNSAAGTSPGTAWKTLQRIRATSGFSPLVGPGDVIKVLAGTYTASQYSDDGSYVDWSASSSKGTSGAPITLQANDGATVVFEGGGTNAVMRWMATSPTDFYWVLKGLIFRHYTDALSAGNSGVGVDADYYAAYIAVLDCTFDNVSPTGANGDGGIGTSYAHHILSIGNTMLEQRSLGHYFGENSQYVVVDHEWTINNYFYGLQHEGHVSDGQPPALSTFNHFIMRRSIYANVTVDGTVFSNSADVRNLYIYNNVFYNDNAVIDPFERGYLGDAGVGMRLNSGAFVGPVHVKNNITWGYFKGFANTGSAFSVGNPSIQGWLEADYNWIKNVYSSRDVNWNATNSLRTGYTFTDYQSVSGQDAHGRTDDPHFTNVGSLVFTLQPDSQAINTGGFLTTTRSGKTSSTILDVYDAGYFHDGYGLIPGDTIQINGSTPSTPVLVQSVDYNANQIILTSPRTWVNNAGVALPWNGTQPDMGAFETGVAASPVVVHVVPSAPNDSVPCASAGLSTPRKTLAGGLACLTVAGSTLYLHAGIYPNIDSAVTMVVGGTDWANPTIIAAYANEAVTLTTSTPGTSVIRLADAANNHYILFDHLILDAGTTTDTIGLRLSGVANIWVKNSTIKNATFPCIYTTNSSGLGIEANRLTGCEDGALLSSTTDAVVSNNLVYGNTSRGLAVGSTSSNVRLYFNSVSGNAVQGISLVSGAATSTVRDNLVYGNVTEIADEAPGTNGNVLDTNFTANPQWFSPGTGDFRLTASTPAGVINAGVAVAGITTDYEGNVRGTPPEIGAYEYTAVPVVVPPSVSSALPQARPNGMFLAR